MITIEKQNTKLGVPPAFSYRCAVRCTEAKFGPSKKGKPMITTQWELVGYFDESGQLSTSMKRGDTLYQLAGLKVRPAYSTIEGKALPFYADFYEACTGEELVTVDETNPDIAYLDGIVMQAIVVGKMEAFRMQLTEEEQEEKKAKGEQPIGAPILDEDGKPIETPSLNIQRFLKKFNGEIPQ